MILGHLFFNFFFGELVVETNIARDVQDTLESFFELFYPLIEVSSKVIESILQFLRLQVYRTSYRFCLFDKSVKAGFQKLYFLVFGWQNGLLELS